jgi:hypothetical protein
MTGESTAASPAPSSTHRRVGSSGPASAPPQKERRATPLRRPLSALSHTLRGLPRAAWMCALVATMSAACWSLITPPFQAPDEPSHFAYVQFLAETGRLPNSSQGAFSQAEDGALSGLRQHEVEWHPEVETISSPAQQRLLREDLTPALGRVGPGGAGVAASEPPLYYALETIPYYIGSSGTLLVQLELMRLLSALMAGVAALFSFLFVRELLPGSRWAWVVGGLGAALQPLLGFTSGVVTPDAMLCAVSAAVFYCLARGFRRGLDRSLGVAIGILIATGFLTKVNFVGLVPGVALGLLVLALRGDRSCRNGPSRSRAFGSVAIALAIGVSPVCIYVLENLLNGHHALGIVSNAVQRTGATQSDLEKLSYIWQFYLPRLPGMVNDFPGLSTLRQLWFDRYVGLYGWLDTPMPVWLDNLALIPAALIAILSVAALARRRALRSHVSEMLVYVVIAIGVLALIGADSNLNMASEGAGYAQPRYLLPLLPLLAATLALAARGAGRRWGPAVGALIIVMFLAQDVFSQLQVVSRFYG